MRVRALLAASLILPLLLLGGGIANAHSGDEVVDEIYSIKHDAMGQIDAVVNQFKSEVKEAPNQAVRDALLAAALEAVEDICKWGVDEINLVAAEHPEEQWAADNAIAYLEDYTHSAEDTMIWKHHKASEGSTTTTTTASAPPPPPPPTISITSPEGGETFEESVVLFVGVATPGAQVNVGPYNAAVDGNGNWSISLVLAEGRNVAKVTASNPAGSATDQVIVYFEPPAVTTTTTVPPTTTTTAAPPTSTTTAPPPTTTTTTTAAAVTGSDGGPPSYQAAFGPLLEGRSGSREATTAVLEDSAATVMTSAAMMRGSNGAFALIRPVIPYALEEPVFSVFAVIEMIGRALTASLQNLLGPAIVTLGYLVVSMVRRRRSVVA